MKTAWRTLLVWSLASGCAPEMELAGEESDDEGEIVARSAALQSQEDGAPAARGKRLFRRETFQGNGRTCQTCHVRANGALSPKDVRRAFRKDPEGPLFRPIDGDNGLPGSYTRLLSRATILVTVPLHPNVRLKDDPDARSVVLERGVPTTFDKHPALERLMMSDGRENDLATQAGHAVFSHAQPGRAPEPGELDDIAAFERTLFSSPVLAAYAAGGPPPELPEGCTPAERRGRRFFEDVPFAPETTGLAGFCAWCHSGPMLNTTNAHNPLQTRGGRFSNAFVSVFNKSGRTPRTYVFTSSAGEEEVASPDPGRGILTGDRRLVNTFRIPTLWNSARTAPFFHDNSAETLHDMVLLYDDLIRQVIGVRLRFAARFTEQDMADIVAFMKLL